MNNISTRFQEKNLPWVVFRINNCSYAINTDIIISILSLPSHITKVPSSPDYITGIINSRGEILPLIDLRTLFSFKSLETEYNEFRQMIDMRKQDHVNWVIELKKTIEQNTEFKLATNPHKCKLGKWYDNFMSTNSVVSFNLNKLDKPHKELHSMVELWEECKKNNSEIKPCQRKEFENNLDELETRILKILDDTKKAFRYHYRQMAISLRNEFMNVAVVVDEVISVQHLECFYNYDDVNNMHKSKFICGTASNGKDDDLILLINNDTLTEVVQQANINLEDMQQVSNL